MAERRQLRVEVNLNALEKLQERHQQLLDVLEAIATFADECAQDASRRYDAISALRIIEAKARFALTGEAS